MEEYIKQRIYQVLLKSKYIYPKDNYIIIRCMNHKRLMVTVSEITYDSIYFRLHINNSSSLTQIRVNMDSLEIKCLLNQGDSMPLIETIIEFWNRCHMLRL